MPPNMVSPGFAYPASRVTPSTLDWPVIGTEPNDDWWREATSIQNRSWHLWRNNPYARAMVETMLEGVLGADGLNPRSLYCSDADRLAVGNARPEGGSDMADSLQARLAIETSLKKAYRGKRFDSCGQLTKRDMSVTMLISLMVAGDGFALRNWKPDRPGDQYQATCWRIIDPARVSNPSWGVNSATRFEGLELNPDTNMPIGIWVQRRNPYAVQVVDYTWDYIPWYDPVSGQLNVVHIKSPGRPDQMRGIGWFASVMGLVNQLGAVTDAYVAAKRVQACIGLIIKVDDAQAQSQQDSQSARSTGAARLYPGMIRYERAGTEIVPLNWDFQGSEHSAFQDSMLQAISAAWGIPMEVVQHRLTKSSVAASRAALMQWYRTAQSAQRLLIDHVEQPWAESVLREEVARRRLPIEVAEDALDLRFTRPPQAFPDPVREATADDIRSGQGKSFSTIAAQQGLDYEQEVLQQAKDVAFAKAHGVQLALKTSPAAPGQDPGNADDGTVDPSAGAPSTTDGQPVPAGAAA